MLMYNERDKTRRCNIKQENSAMIVQEIERALHERLYAWEGKPEQVVDFGEVVVHIQPGLATAFCLRFESAQLEKRLDEIKRRVEPLASRCLWVISPSTKPVDIEEQLLSHGFTKHLELAGMVLEDLSVSLASNPQVVVELLSWDNVEEYATVCSPPNDLEIRNEQLTYAKKYLQFAHKEIQIFIARLNSAVVGYAFLRVEANGMANLCEAFTIPHARGQGVYLSLLAHRLAFAKEQGCTMAITRANTQTSAPTLIKRGFKPVCRFPIFVLEREKA